MAKSETSEASSNTRRPRGRPRAENKDPGASRASVGDKLLRTLIRDPDFLTPPQSEGQTARLLSVNKSALREAVIGFVRVGWLKRSEEGIRREELTPARLVDLFAIRLFIEWNSIRRVIKKTTDERDGICLRLARIINEQANLVKSDSDDDRIDWFMCSVRFHVMITQEAGCPDYARILESVLWLLRIGSCVPLEDLDWRERVTSEHRQIIADIREARLEEREFIKDHIRRPLERGLMRLLSVHAIEKGGGTGSPKAKQKPPPEITKAWDLVQARFSQLPSIEDIA